VVEDHEDAVEIAQTVLSYAGAQVTTCTSPERALVLLPTLLLDAVLTDLGFGDDPMAGASVLHAVRQRPGRCAVIAVTGRKEVEADLHRMGFDAVLVKPVDPFDLLAAVVGSVIVSR
jgi:CheY-like chemotaxis protein